LEEEFNNWEEETMNKKEKEGYNWIQNIYWKLDIVSCVLVLRNKIWFSTAIESIREIWKIIEKERIDKTWVDRKPKPNNKKLVKNNINKVVKGQPLLIKIDI
jgi:hypothetical protein